MWHLQCLSALYLGYEIYRGARGAYFREDTSRDVPDGVCVCAECKPCLIFVGTHTDEGIIVYDAELTQCNDNTVSGSNQSGNNRQASEKELKKMHSIYFLQKVSG